MHKIQTSDNSGVILKIAKKNLNFIVIGIISMLLALCDTVRMRDTLLNDYPIYVSIATMLLVYGVYTALVGLISLGIRNIWLPKEIRILDKSIELHTSLLIFKIDAQEFIVNDTDKNENNSIMRKYKVEKPAVITLRQNEAELSIPLEADELLKLRSI